MNGNIIRGPMQGSWAPGYFYILFEDPDKIRLEVNYVPDKGVLKKNIKFNPSNDYWKDIKKNINIYSMNFFRSGS